MSETPVLDSAAVEGLVGRVADEFTERLNRGERPEVEEYARRYPEVAGVLRQVLPSLRLIRLSGAEPVAGPAEPAGCLGDFRVVREVGRGGMGVVYEAEQLSLARRVALKVLPFAGALDARQLQRFKNEALAAACLQHQHIVPVYFVGSERGVHFFAMQYVEGQTLAAVIAELRRLGGRDGPAAAGAGAGLAGELAGASWPTTAPRPAAPQPTGPYTPPRGPGAADTGPQRAASSTERSLRSPAYFRTAARLGLQAAEALEHAHGLGVVHRDVKPANLMVDARGELWVTDFGLAQVQSDTRLTLTGDLVGTLRYMSPEQALAQRVGIDHRTDVYSLGTTLYELLTLEPAIVGSDRQELLRQIAFEEPRPPRKLNKAIPADLETIALKAMEKSPAERYQTAQELADDLRRFLEDQPIRARRPSLRQRVTKWARRHRAVVWSAGVAALLILALGLVGLAVSNDRLERARQQTADQRDEAKRKRREARRAVDKMFTEFAEGWLADQPHLEEKQRHFLLNALEFYEAFARERTADPAERLGAVQAYRRVGEIQHKLGQLAKAEAAYRQGIALVGEYLAEPPPDEYHLRAYREEEGGCHHNLALLLKDTGQFREAKEAYLLSIAAFQRLVDEFPDAPERRHYRAAIALAHKSLGALLAASESLPTAERSLRKSITLWKGLAGEEITVGVYAGLCDANEGLGHLLLAAGRAREAEAPCREALKMAKRLVEHDRKPEHENRLAHCQTELGLVLGRLGRGEQAEQQSRDALALYRKLAANFPMRPDYRQGKARGLGNLAATLVATGRRAEAELLYRQARDEFGELARKFPEVPEYQLELGMLYHNLGVLWQQAGKVAEARKAHAKAVEIVKRLVDKLPDSPHQKGALALALNRLAGVLQTAHEPRKAEEAHGRALQLQQELVTSFPRVPAYRAAQAQTYADLASLLEETDRLTDAEGGRRKALQVWQRLVKEFPSIPDYRRQEAVSHYNFGLLLLRTGRYKDGKAAFGKALELHKRLAAEYREEPGHRHNLAVTYTALGNLSAAAGGFRDAERAYRDALAIDKELAKELPKEPEHRAAVAGGYYNLGILFGWREKRPREAEAALREAVAGWEKLAADVPGVPEYRHQLGGSRCNLAIFLEETGRPKEAEATCKLAIGVADKLVKECPEVADYRRHLAKYQRQLARLLLAASRPGEAKTACEQALKHLRHLVSGPSATPDHHSDLGRTLDVLALILRKRGELHQAQEVLLEAVSHQQRALKHSPGQARYHESFREHWVGLVETLERQNKPLAAEEVLHRVTEFLEKLAAGRPKDPELECGLGAARNDWAIRLTRRGQFASARRKLEQAIAHQKFAHGSDPSNPAYRKFLGKHHSNLAFVLQGLADHAGAARQAERLARLTAESWEGQEKAARLMYGCMELAKKDAKLSAASRPAVVSRYRARCIELLKKSLKLHPDNPEAANVLAWFLVAGPDAARADSAWAAGLMADVVKRKPTVAAFWNTLGVAHYRAGDWPKAVTALNQSLKLGSSDAAAADHFFLAMAHWRLRDKDQARKWYDQGVRWLEEHQGGNDEVRRFHAEAASVLGIKDQPMRKKGKGPKD
jgi:eukaryotic-like serine/threonine-protein kinase